MPNPSEIERQSEAAGPIYQELLDRNRRLEAERNSLLDQLADAREERDLAEGECERLTAELKLWRPMTPEEAEAALDAIREEDCPPLSEEQITRMVAKVTDPTWCPTEPERVRLVAQVERLRAALKASRPLEHQKAVCEDCGGCGISDEDSEGDEDCWECDGFGEYCTPDCPGCESERLRKEALGE